MMKRFFVPLFFSAVAVFGSEIDTYGKQYSFMGVLQDVQSSDLGIPSNQGHPDSTTVIYLDKSITKLPLPVIPGNTMSSGSGVTRLIVYFSSENQKEAVHPECRVEIMGSIWYADWLSETNPLLLIVDEIRPLPFSP